MYKARLLLLLISLVLSGCMMPATHTVRMPKPFERKQVGQYTPQPVAARLRLPVLATAVLLYFDDDREIQYPPVERLWSDQARLGAFRGRKVQPREIGGILWKGLENGLRYNYGLKVISPEEYERNPRADMVIKGRITKCLGGASWGSYFGEVQVEVEVLDRNGRNLMGAPAIGSGQHEKVVRESQFGWGVQPTERKEFSPTIELAMEKALGQALNNEALRAAVVQAAR